MRHDTIASFLQKKFLAKIVTYGSLASRWRFEAPVRGNPLEFGDEIWRRKTRVLGLPDDEEIMPLAFFVLTEYRRVTDGRTDRQTDRRTRCCAYYPR